LKFGHALTLGSYDAAIRDVVLRMKHWRQDSLSQAVAELLAETLDPQLAMWPIDVVVAVPMHWRRRIVRSTNSPELVAETIAKRLQRPLSRRSLKRTRATRPQGTLSPRERRKNVRDAFRLARGSDWRGANVLLVDDILTTGATCSEIARVLKSAGAAEVNVVVVARAQGNL
jgi:ComF family protein